MRFARILLPAFAVLLTVLRPAFADDAKLPLTLAVYGDSLGDGIWSGLYTLLRSHPETTLLRRSKIGAGLTRPDYAAWLADLKTSLDADHVDVAVIMFGANDQQNLRDDNRKGHVFQTDSWKQVYGGRVDAVLQALAEHKVGTVIWVGLPVMRKDEMDAGAKYLDTIFTASATANDAHFLPLRADFADPNGAFQSHMNDKAGRSKQIRADDGVHFTGYGYELLAAKVLDQLAQLRGPAASH